MLFITCHLYSIYIIYSNFFIFFTNNTGHWPVVCTLEFEVESSNLWQRYCCLERVAYLLTCSLAHLQTLKISNLGAKKTACGDPNNCRCCQRFKKGSQSQMNIHQQHVQSKFVTYYLCMQYWGWGSAKPLDSNVIINE